MRIVAILAAVVGASQLFALPTQAATYSFTAGVDAGTFTTGAASPIEPGYFLVTDFDFTALVLSDAPGSTPITVDFTHFDTDTAFDPVLDQFINGGTGHESPDTGGFAKEVDFQILDIAPFQVDGSFLTVTYGDGQDSFFQGPFEVTSGLPASPAPEPGAWVLMIAGFGSVGLMQRRQRKSLGLWLGKA